MMVNDNSCGRDKRDFETLRLKQFFLSLFLPLKFKPLHAGPLDVIPATQTPRVQTR